MAAIAAQTDKLTQIIDWCVKGGIDPQTLASIDRSQGEIHFLKSLAGRTHRSASLVLSDIRTKSGLSIFVRFNSPEICVSQTALREKGVDYFKEQVLPTDYPNLEQFVLRPDNDNCFFSEEVADFRSGIAGFGKEIVCASKNIDQFYLLYGGKVHHLHLNKAFEDQTELKPPEERSLQWTPKNGEFHVPGSGLRFIALVGEEQGQVQIR